MSRIFTVAISSAAKYKKCWLSVGGTAGRVILLAPRVPTLSLMAEARHGVLSGAGATSGLSRHREKTPSPLAQHTSPTILLLPTCKKQKPTQKKKTTKENPQEQKQTEGTTKTLRDEKVNYENRSAFCSLDARTGAKKSAKVR